jgi:hypothetical protein
VCHPSPLLIARLLNTAPSVLVGIRGEYCHIYFVAAYIALSWAVASDAHPVTLVPHTRAVHHWSPVTTQHLHEYAAGEDEECWQDELVLFLYAIPAKLLYAAPSHLACTQEPRDRTFISMQPVRTKSAGRINWYPQAFLSREKYSARLVSRACM